MTTKKPKPVTIRLCLRDADWLLSYLDEAANSDQDAKRIGSIIRRDIDLFQFR